MVQTAWRSCKWPITENNEVQDGCGTEYLETPNLWTGKFPNKKKKKTKHLLYFKMVVSLVIFVYKHWSKYCLEIQMILKFTDWAKMEKLLVILSAHCRNTSLPKAGLTDLERPPFWQGYVRALFLSMSSEHTILKYRGHKLLISQWLHDVLISESCSKILNNVSSLLFCFILSGISCN